MPPPTPSPAVVEPDATEPTLLDPESEEWGRLIRRRGELIHKKNRVGLSEAEKLEFARLERIVDATMEERFPPNANWEEQLAAIEAQLAVGGGPTRNGT